jgi:putative pantetheine hydrolase
VAVRGGGPGTRETDLLDPRNAVQRVHAIVLSGGSSFGLAAADGVLHSLAAEGTGLNVGPGIVVPIVPAAVIFDLHRGGEVSAHPDASFGWAAYADAVRAGPGAGGPQGSVGAGTGAVSGRIKGGVGSASSVAATGETVAALAIVNSFGSTVDPHTGELYGARFGMPGEFSQLVRPTTQELAAYNAAGGAGPSAAMLNTTIGVVATEVALTKAQCAKLAEVAHDGLARSVRPAHTMLDGDTIFALSTHGAPAPDEAEFGRILAAGADCFARAMVHAVLAASFTETRVGRWLSYRDLFPSAFARA